MTGNDRSSYAAEPQLITDKLEIAKIEAANTLRQFDAAMNELRRWLGEPQYRLRPSTILYLNRAALDGLSKYAGIYRPASVEIQGSKHAPVPAADVPRLVEDFCDYIHQNWNKSAVHLASYALWRLNWIHPFVDGNGRTARAISYLILCARLGYRLPGEHTIPEQIADNKQPYYKALEAADWSDRSGVLNVTEVEKLIEGHLASQLVDIHNHATANVEGPGLVRNPVEDVSDPGTLRNLIEWIEKHPVLVGAVAIILAAMVGVLFVH